jgi:hypothetical protein
MLQGSGFTDVLTGEPADTFGGAQRRGQGPRVPGIRLRVHGEPSSLND